MERLVDAVLEATLPSGDAMNPEAARASAEIGEASVGEWIGTHIEEALRLSLAEICVHARKAATGADVGEALEAIRDTGDERTILSDALSTSRWKLDHPEFAATDTAPSDPRPEADGRALSSLPKRIGGKYEVLRLLGTGGFGSVVEARDRSLGNRVAIKVLHASSSGKLEEIEKFKEEARRIARLDHPSIVDVKVLDESAEGVCYFVMDLVDGEDLSKILAREGRLKPRRVCRLILQILDALRAAHELGENESVLHLDIKPRNVLVEPGPRGTEDERVKIIDFGIGQVLAAGGRHREVPDHPPDLACGEGAGRDRAGADGSSGRESRIESCTPEFASPEMCGHFLRGVDPVELDGRSDLYSVGVLAFLLLTGELPFDRPARRKDLLRLHREAAPKTIRSLGVRVPRKLEQFVQQCLVKDRDLRWSSTSEAFEAMRTIVEPPWVRHPVLWGVSAALSLGLVTAAGVAAWTWSDPQLPPLEPLLLVDGQETNLADGRLYLGPERDRVQLRMSGLAEGGIPTACRLVDDERRDQPVQGWGVDLAGDGTVELEVNADRPVREWVRFELDLEGGDAQLSRPVELVYLAADRWKLSAAVVGLVDGAVLDPIGQFLQVEIVGPEDGIQSVVVLKDGTRHSVPVIGDDGRPDLSIGSFDLSGLPWTDGEQVVAVEMRDRAGLRRTWSRSLTVATEDLELQPPSLDCVLVGGDYHVRADRSPELRLIASRPADFTWSVVDRAGTRMAGGAARPGADSTTTLTDLGRLKGGAPYQAWLEIVADEGERVHHAPGSRRGIASERISFVVGSGEPALRARVRGADGGWGDLVPGHVLSICDGSAELEVFTRASEPARVAVNVQMSGQPEDEWKRVVRFEPPFDLSARMPLDLTTPGSHRVRIELLQPEEAQGDAVAARETHMLELWLDSAPPALSLESAEDVLVRSRAELPATCRLRISDAGAAPSASSELQLFERVSLRVDAEAPGPFRCVSSGLAPGARELQLPDPGETRGRTEGVDGDYLVELRARDAAGNVSAIVPIRLRIAIDGPVMEVLRPQAGRVWSPGERGEFRLSILAGDENGVESIRASLTAIGTNLSATRMLERITDATRSAVESRWRTSFQLDHTWSGRDVELRLEGRDEPGAQSTRVWSGTLDRIDPDLPSRLISKGDRAALSAMRLVRGNRDSEYVFGGRGDVVEEQARIGTGLEPYNQQATPRSWQVVFSAGEVEDYYLDEREVSCADFLAFLARGDGYASAAWWPAGTGPTDARRKELTEALGLRSGNLPVSGVTWDEARAFAAWAGKRLPSLVEWEYAVRGGAEYRPCSWWGGAERDGPFERGERGLRPVLSGRDVTPLTGIGDLCTNVAEWTSVPFLVDDRDLLRKRFGELVAASKSLYLEGGDDVLDAGVARWVAGGSWRGTREDFSAAERRPSCSSAEHVGFRCALDAEAFLAQGERELEGRVWFLGDRTEEGAPR